MTAGSWAGQKVASSVAKAVASKAVSMVVLMASRWADDLGTKLAAYWDENSVEHSVVYLVGKTDILMAVRTVAKKVAKTVAVTAANLVEKKAEK